MSHYTTPTGERYTAAQARRDGYQITRDSYGWHVEEINTGAAIDERGGGYATRAQALAAAWNAAQQAETREALADGAALVRAGRA